MTSSPGDSGRNDTSAACFLKSIGALLGGGVAMAVWLDAAVIRVIHAHLTAERSDLFDTVSDVADARFYGIAALGIYASGLLALSVPALRHWKHRCEHWVRASLLMLLTLLTGGFLTLVLKHVVARARPFLLLENGQYGFAAPFAGAPFNSFPSSHAFTAFAVAFVLADLFPNWRKCLLAVAAIPSTCRVLALEHFPSDVITSAVIAAWCEGFWASRIFAPRSNWPLRRPWHWRSAPAPEQRR
ncbi:membrane-associated phospholipid phosphatase [Variovorax paradoxus]|uniref:Membrane-associated phospholipid phosphatase n=1 Tax=Variovorax paradoxus TaxID=34073 RepID=A0AAE4C040_VARPD|nr:phosphatase PAP2 family protein [Variovorax paradoxus]MDP9965459.1 membrane-associated phospholipid phosphatase [Variovorax paradoxus]MDR6428717.1 membrane-associated phospholipid phosphatase [Variovorax paradoxus]MDR6455957.1 membrane-associated phospholipid phosphatase [Variovorax paradoxus]